MSKASRRLLALSLGVMALFVLPRGETITRPAVSAAEAQPNQQQVASSPPPVVAEQASAPPCAPATATGESEGKIRRGDRIKLAFYELLEVQEDKWGAERQRLEEPRKGIQQRAEFSNEYLVNQEGSISVPILGAFPATILSQGQLQQLVQCAFSAFLGRKGFVNILNVTRQPVYVVGGVKNSGNFDFAEGMTVLHAIALAGGFDKAQIEPWQIAEMTRESQRIQTALDQASRKIARATAIEAANTGQPAAAPAELAQLSGTNEAASQVSAEYEPLSLELKAAANNEASLSSTIRSAESEREIRKASLPILEQSIALRRERVESLIKLSKFGTIARPVVIQAQSELLDAEDRRQQTLTATIAAEDRLTNAREQLDARRAQVAINYKNNLLTARNAASEAIADGESAASVLRSMTTSTLSAIAEDPQFRVVRRTGAGVVAIQATGTMLLEPGDLVEVKRRSEPASMATDQANAIPFGQGTN
jgi:polysaccharide biosynthesis/export protein ExoF